MTTLREAAQQALEALTSRDGDGWTRRFARDRAIEALEAALAEPVQEPAQQDNETIAQTFSGLPKRKLRELLAAGWQINGVCFQRTEEDGTVRRGAATTGGMVLWWNQEQPAQQQEPVAWSFEARHIDTAFGPAVSIRHPGREHKYMRNVKPLYTAPPQRKPLTEEEIDSIWDSEKVFPDIYAIARAVERAHGIGGEG